MKTIGYITSSVDLGNGIGHFSREVVLRVAALGHRPRVLTSAGDVVDPELEAAEGVEVRRVLPGRKVLNGLWRNILWGKRAAAELAGCDLVHTLADFPYTEVGARAARRLDVPLVASIVGAHTVAPLYQRPYGGRLAVALLEAHRVISVSRYTLAELEKRLQLHNSVVVPLGVDARGLTRDLQAVPPPSDRFMVLGVGALEVYKGWDLLIQAAAQLRELTPPVHVTIVGGPGEGTEPEDSELPARLRSLAADLGISDRVHLPGAASPEALGRYYAGSHLFAMPTRASETHEVEGFGLVYLEAGAFGLPQIGSLDSGASEPILDGETGFLVPQNDPQAVAAAISRLHADPALRERIGSQAHERALAMTWDATVAGILSHYPADEPRRRPSRERRLVQARW